MLPSVLRVSEKNSSRKPAEQARSQIRPFVHYAIALRRFIFRAIGHRGDGTQLVGPQFIFHLSKSRLKLSFGGKLTAITFHSSPEIYDQIDQAKIEYLRVTCGDERKVLLLR